MSMSSLKTIKILDLKNSIFFRYPNFYLGEAVFDKNNDKEKKISKFSVFVCTWFFELPSSKRSTVKPSIKKP